MLSSSEEHPYKKFVYDKPEFFFMGMLRFLISSVYLKQCNLFVAKSDEGIVFVSLVGNCICVVY